MDSNSKVFVAGHNGLVGSAIIRNLEKKIIIISIGFVEKTVTLQIR